MAQHAQQFNKEIQILKQVNLQYLLYLPELYTETNERLPLILFLHGRDQRGDDLNLLKIRGIPQLIDTKDNFPFIVLSPQCPSYYIWPSVFDGILAILDEVSRNYPVDPNRIYLTGLSMGGYAVWDLAMDYPDRFAAIAPVSASGSAERVNILKEIPVWAFHGEKDDVVPVEEVHEIISALVANGGNAQLTVYPDADHDAWTEAYSNSQLYNWFLEHSKEEI